MVFNLEGSISGIKLLGAISFIYSNRGYIRYLTSGGCIRFTIQQGLYLVFNLVGAISCFQSSRGYIWYLIQYRLYLLFIQYGLYLEFYQQGLYMYLIQERLCQVLNQQVLYLVFNQVGGYIFSSIQQGALSGIQSSRG